MTEGIEEAMKNQFLYIGINGDNINFKPQLPLLREATNAPIFIATTGCAMQKQAEAVNPGADLYGQIGENPDDNCGYGYSTQNFIKVFWRHLDKFALEMDVSTRNYASLLTPDIAAVVSTKKPSTDEEIQTIWQSQSSPWVDSVLFMLYTGFRISEMLGLQIENINLEDGIMQGGIKTKAGKDRIVPIHSKIRHIVERRMKEGGKYLFSHNGKKCGDSTYRTFWCEIMDTAKIQHTPHECRHTFRSRLDSADANKRCIDLIMGHQSKEVGERVYTHKTFKELKAAIELLG